MLHTLFRCQLHNCVGAPQMCAPQARGEQEWEVEAPPPLNLDDLPHSLSATLQHIVGQLDVLTQVRGVLAQVPEVLALVRGVLVQVPGVPRRQERQARVGVGGALSRGADKGVQKLVELHAWTQANCVCRPHFLHITSLMEATPLNLPA